jgi:hypothetical protein
VLLPTERPAVQDQPRQIVPETIISKITRPKRTSSSCRVPALQAWSPELNPVPPKKKEKKRHKKISIEAGLDMMIYACYPTTWKENQEFKATMAYKTRLCLRNKQTKLSICLFTCDPAIPLLGFYSKEMKAYNYTKIYTQIFTVILQIQSVISKIRIQMSINR